VCSSDLYGWSDHVGKKEGLYKQLIDKSVDLATTVKFSFGTKV
jgi:hypothetical protein